MEEENELYSKDDKLEETSDQEDNEMPDSIIGSAELSSYTVNSKGLSLSVFPTSKINNACVSVSVGVKGGNQWIAESMSNISNAGFDLSIVLTSLTDHIRGELQKFFSTTKIVKVESCLHGECFCISAICGSSGSAIKKTLAVICLNLCPNKLYQKYAAKVKLCEYKPDKAAFVHAANAINKAANGGIEALITGKCTVAKDKMAEFCSKLSKNISHEQMSGEASARQLEKVDKIEDHYSCIKISGISRVLLRNISITKFRECGVVSNNCIYYSGSTAKKIGNLKADFIKTLVSKMFKKYGGQIAGILAYLAASYVTIPIDSITKEAKKGETEIVSGLKSVISK